MVSYEGRNYFLRSPRLLRRSPMLPNESLLSLLCRLDALNYFGPFTSVYDLCREASIIDRKVALHRPTEDRVYQELSKVTILKPEEIYRATVHRFATTLTPPDEEILTKDIDGNQFPILAHSLVTRYTLSERSVQYCPLCLGDAPYHRIHWALASTYLCLKHKCLLTQTCGSCSEQVTVMATVQRQCQKCGYDLSKTEVDSVADDHFGLFVSQSIRAWMCLDALPKNDGYYFPNNDVRTLFRLLTGFVYSLQKVRADWPYWHPDNSGHSIKGSSSLIISLSPQYRYRLYSTGFKAFRDWPEGFIAFLKYYRENIPNSHLQDQPLAQLGSLYYFWINKNWRSKHFSFIQSAFEEYLNRHCTDSLTIQKSYRCKENPALAEKFPYIGLSEAARIIGCSIKAIRRLVSLGRLSAHKPLWRSAPNDIIVLRAEVLQLQQEFSEAKSLDIVVEYLGLSKMIVTRLVELGLVSAYQNPSSGIGARWLFKMGDIEKWFEAMLRKAKASYKAETYPDLIKASQIVSSVGLDAATLIKHGSVIRFSPERHGHAWRGHGRRSGEKR